MKKNSYKKFLLDVDSDDESEEVCWDDNEKKKEFYNCGCCDECLCDDNVECGNCGCNCNCEEIDDDYEIDDDESDYEVELTDDNNDHTKKHASTISNFDINIIESKEKEKKVRITLELNVSLSNNKKEIINIDLDINKTTYLKIAEELFKK